MTGPDVSPYRSRAPGARRRLRGRGDLHGRPGDPGRGDARGRAPAAHREPDGGDAPAGVGRGDGRPAFYLAVDQAVDDAFPLRAAAVVSRALIDYRALGGSTNPEVVVGRDRWLFLAGEVFPRCLWEADEVLATRDGLAAEFRQQGIDVRFVIAPDKRTAYPQMLPPVMDGRPTCTTRACRDAGRDRRATRYDGRPVGSGPRVPSRLATCIATTGPTRTGRRRALQPGIRAMVESIEPGLWDAAPPARAATRITSATSRSCWASPRASRAPVFERPGITLSQVEIPVTAKSGSIRPVVRYTATGGGVVPGTTLIVYDSFLRIIEDDVAPWFADSVWLHVDDLSRHGELAAQMPAFDRVIVERGERLAYLTAYEVMLRPLLERP